MLGLGIGEELIVYGGVAFFLVSCINYGSKCAFEFSKATGTKVFGLKASAAGPAKSKEGGASTAANKKAK